VPQRHDRRRPAGLLDALGLLVRQRQVDRPEIVAQVILAASATRSLAFTPAARWSGNAI